MIRAIGAALFLAWMTDTGQHSSTIVSGVQFRSGADDVPAILARPARAGKFPAVLLIHANSLQEPYIRETAARLAEQGFVAVAIDVFHFLPRVSWPEHQRLPGDVIRSRLAAEFREERLVRDMQAGIDFIRTLPSVRSGGVGLIGFCGGGWNALLVAAQSVDVAAVVAFYAPVAAADSSRRSAQSLSTFIRVPVQFHRATDDPHVPALDVERFVEALRAMGTPIADFSYQARHGFVASNRTGVFDSAAAELAWSRVVPFLRAHVGKRIRQRLLAPARHGPADTSQIRRLLEQRYARQDSAIARRDLADFLGTLTPRYGVELRDGQRFTRPGIDSAIARDMRQTRAVSSIATEVESLEVSGDTVWVTVVHRADRTLADEQGRPHRWENGVRHEEGWVHNGVEWYIAVLREREQLYLRRDGVRFP
jgi:carboxymethylenebutenolidase